MGYSREPSPKCSSMPLDEESTSPPICDYEGSDYQAVFWDQSDRAYEDRAEALALKRLLPSSGDLLLDLGAGAGRNVPRFRGYRRIVLLDYSSSQLIEAQKRLGQSNRYAYVAADVYRLPFVPGVFHAAVMIRVIHHLTEPRRALRQIREVLRPRGTLILEFANKQNIKAILRYLLGRQTWSPFTPEAIEFAKLNFDFHPATMRTWLQQASFALDRQLTVSHFRAGLFKKVVPLWLLVKMDGLAQWTGTWWQLSPSVFTRSRAVGEGRSAEPGALFRCPICATPLPQADALLPWSEGQPDGNVDSAVFTCPGCSREWKYRGGIFNFKTTAEG